MATDSVTVEFKGDWEELKTTLSPRALTAALVRELGKATKENAAYVAGEIRKTIRGGVPPPNRPLTRLLKRSKKPLIDDADLVKAVTFEAYGWNLAAAGLFRTAGRHRGSIETLNLGWLLHQGATLRVTPQMRKMFDVLDDYTNPDIPEDKKPKLTGRAADIIARVGKRKIRIHRLSSSTQAIRIPGRPFITETFNRKEVRRSVFDRWREAVLRALNHPKRGRGLTRAQRIKWSAIGAYGDHGAGD